MVAEELLVTWKQFLFRSFFREVLEVDLPGTRRGHNKCFSLLPDRHPVYSYPPPLP